MSESESVTVLQWIAHPQRVEDDRLRVIVGERCEDWAFSIPTEWIRGLILVHGPAYLAEPIVLPRGGGGA